MARRRRSSSRDRIAAPSAAAAAPRRGRSRPAARLCGGSGQVAKGGGFFQMVSTCPQCQGTGHIVKNPCPTCRGSGRVPKKRTVTIKIPPGVHEGQGIRVAGEGEPGRDGGPNGDLYCLRPHQARTSSWSATATT